MGSTFPVSSPKWYLFGSLQEQKRSIFGHFRYGLRYGYHFGELTGKVEVDFWSFLLRIDPSPQNEFGPFFTLGPTISSHSMTLGPTIFSHFTTLGPTIFSHSLTLDPKNPLAPIDPITLKKHLRQVRGPLCQRHKNTSWMGEGCSPQHAVLSCHLYC